MSRIDDDEVILERERKLGRPAGAAALASVAATIGTVMLASTASGNSALPQGASALQDEAIDRAKVLVRFNDNEGLMGASIALRCLGLLLMIAVGVYLYRLVKTRDDQVAKTFILYLTFIAPALMCAALVTGYVAFGNVADTLVASGPRTVGRAGQLIDDSGGLRIAQLSEVGSRIVVAFWLALIATAAMRVGLLTRFLGYWGVAAGASLALLPGGGGDAMMAGWIGSMGILALGWWPGGRPLAWTSTEPQEIEAI